MKAFDRTINVLQLLATLATLIFVVYTFYPQVIIPSRPIIKMTNLAKHTETGKIISQLTNVGKSPVSNSIVRLVFVPFEGNDPMENEAITVESTLRDLGADESETVSFDLSFTDKRFEVNKVFFVIMCVEDDELLEKVVTDIWYRYALDRPWVPLRGNSAFVDDNQETAINALAERIKALSQRSLYPRFVFRVDWMIFWTAVGALGTIAVAFLAVAKDYIQRRPKLKLEPESFEGRRVLMGSTPGCYYHLKVTNLRPHIPAVNTKLFCTTIRLIGANARERKFQPPGQFVWAPAEIPEISPNISSIPRTIDFIRFISNHAEPVLFVYPNTGEHEIPWGEDAELDLELAADNLPASLKYKVQLTWKSKSPPKLAGLQSPCGHFSLNLIDVKR